MTLRFIYGRSGSGKTRLCLEEIKARHQEGVEHPLVLLVPEQYSLQAERDLIDVLETGGILKIQVMTFRRLAFRIFGQAGGLAYPHLHPAGKAMILHRILDKIQGDLHVFTHAVQRQGFVGTLSELITEFKRYEISPEALLEVCSEMDPEDPLSMKLGEIQLVYSVFEEALFEKYRDTEDSLTVAAQKLEETTLFDGAEIWIDGFSGFTPQEYSLVAGLMTKGARINISLSTDCLEAEDIREEDIFAAVKGSYAKLIELAQERGIKVEKPVFLNSKTPVRFRNSPELAHLEENLYAFPYKKYDEETKDVSLFYSMNIFSEIQECAREILALCRDRGLRYREITVVTGNLDVYESLIEVIFTEYGIPFFLDRKQELKNHPLIRLVLSVLDIFIDNWTYEAVFRYLKTDLTGVAREQVDRLENYVLACGIRGSKWTASEGWTMSPGMLPSQKDSLEEEELLDELNGIRCSVIEPLLEFRGKTKGRSKASDFCSALFELLSKLGVPERIEAAVEDFNEQGQLSLAQEYSQVWNILMEVFDQIVAVMGEDTFGIERFSNILQAGLEEYRIGLIPPALDQVLVGNVERSKSHEIKALFVLGVNDGVFPAPMGEEGVLSDRDRNLLKEKGVEIAGDTRTQAFDEPYLVYKTLTTPSCLLRLSWSIADHEGKALRPSMIISRLGRIFPKITAKGNVLEPLDSQDNHGDISLVAGQEPSFKEMVAVFRQVGVTSPPLLWQEVYLWFSRQDQWQERSRSLIKAFKHRNVAHPISSEQASLLYGSPAHSSVSRLEQYASCPFAYYVRYGLKAQERQVFQMSAPDIGTFMHAVIEQFSLEVVREELSWRELDRPWCNAKVSEIVDGIINKMQGGGISGSRRYTALARRLKRVISRSVWVIVQQIGGGTFEPVGYEVDFSEDGDFPPITVELQDGQKVLLTGRIDRVDALETEEGTYFRIIDYKSGRKDFKLADVYHGLQLQLLTYADAIWEHGSTKLPPPVIPGGLLYFKIDDPLIKGGSDTTKEELEQALRKELKMKGLVLADLDVIRAMDRDLEGDSLIIPVRINKGDTLGSRSSVASVEQLKLLRNYTRVLLQELCEEIMKGDVAIKPYKSKDRSSCQYCPYSSVCQFDSVRKENRYQVLTDYNERQLWEKMAQEAGLGEEDD